MFGGKAGGTLFGGFLPEGAIFQKTGDELGVQGVAGLVGDEAPLKRAAYQRQIADQIERFVANEFVGKAQRAVQDGIVVHDDGIGERAAANQAHFLEGHKLLDESEGAGGGEFAAERLAIDGHLDFLRAGAGMVVIHEAVHAKFVGRVDADAAVAVGEFERLDDVDIAALAAQTPGSGARQHFDKWPGRTVEDGKFEGVQLHVDVVYAAAVQRRQEVLGGRDQHALFHQAGGVADAGDVGDIRFDFEVVEVHATKNYAGVRRRRDQAQTALDRRVEADAFDLNGMLDGKLAGH